MEIDTQRNDTENDIMDFKGPAPQRAHAQRKRSKVGIKPGPSGPDSLPCPSTGNISAEITSEPHKGPDISAMEIGEPDMSAMEIGRSDIKRPTADSEKQRVDTTILDATTGDMEMLQWVNEIKNQEDRLSSNHMSDTKDTHSSVFLCRSGVRLTPPIPDWFQCMSKWLPPESDDESKEDEHKTDIYAVGQLVRIKNAHTIGFPDTGNIFRKLNDTTYMVRSNKPKSSLLKIHIKDLERVNISQVMDSDKEQLIKLTAAEDSQNFWAQNQSQ